jgi:hypothetical protein
MWHSVYDSNTLILNEIFKLGKTGCYTKNVVDYFQTCNSDRTELGCIMIVCKKLFHIYFFKTLLSNLAADKPMKLVKP